MVGQPAKAMEKSELVLESAPDDVDAQLLKGAVLVVGKETAKARAYLEGLQAKGIDRPDVYLLLARVYTRRRIPGREPPSAGIKGHPKECLYRALATCTRPVAGTTRRRQVRK
jgi:hypothetical protein